MSAMNGADPLAQLRDIHLPPPVSSWPPAPGWWLLALLLVVLLTAAIALWLRRRRRNAYRRAALVELQRLGADHAADVAAINALLKRTALAAGFTESAALSGEAWLQFLERTRGRGAPLLQSPDRDALLSLYAPAARATDATQLQKIAARWIRRHRC